MSISRAFRRQGERKEQRARESALYERHDVLYQLGQDRLDDAALLIMDKHEELHGLGEDPDRGYSARQIKEITRVIAAYTPDEFDAAVALAKALVWEEKSDFNSDYYERRVAQRRLQGRGTCGSCHWAIERWNDEVR
jgi:hypothetical protein